MIPVPKPGPSNEPYLFESNCRTPGKDWLAQNPAPADPHSMNNWWSQFQPHLSELFESRCGWLGTYIGPDGSVDHYISCDSNRNLAFEWSNYRYASGPINSRKGTLDDQVLDPCDVKDGWFKISLDGFQLLPTEAIPENLRAKAKITLDELDLRNGHKARTARWNFYKNHWNNGVPDIDALRIYAPLLAQAVQEALNKGLELPDPTTCRPTVEIKKRQHPYKKRTKKNDGGTPT